MKFCLFSCLLTAVLCLFASTPIARGSIQNFRVIDAANCVYRGGQPTTAADYKHLHDDLGVLFIVKLDTDSEGSDALAEAAGIHVIYIPMTFKQQTIGEPTYGQIAFAVSCMESGHVFVHCKHGTDRTGLVCGAYRVMVGHWAKSDAEKEMMADGFNPWWRGTYWAWQHLKSK